jgi:hypothetical protein
MEHGGDDGDEAKCGGDDCDGACWRSAKHVVRERQYMVMVGREEAVAQFGIQ